MEFIQLAINIMCMQIFFPDHLFVTLLFQADYQRAFQEIIFGDIRNADISKISSLLKQGVDPNIYNKVGLLNNITALLMQSLE